MPQTLNINFIVFKMKELRMNLSEEIFPHVQTLAESLKVEVLDFVEYLQLKSKESDEEKNRSTLSLSSAMRGLEDEPASYEIDDLK